MKLSILGSTGSIGTQAVCVAKELGVKIGILAAGRNFVLLAEQIKELSPEIISVADKETADNLSALLDGKQEIIYGREKLNEAILNTDSDVILHSIAGLEGTSYAISAAKTGARLAMANKEAIIAAGSIIFDELKKSGGTLVPVDSEHSAIFQCLHTDGRLSDPNSISRILLTASGGPFFGKTKEEMAVVTPEMALAHPTWKMGPKITVDSATLMNKGFEVIEAVRLFGVRPEQVEVLVHRQSIIHSMVEYIDNSVIAQLASPDMRAPIRYALSYPERAEAQYGKLDFFEIGKLTFDKPDYQAFPLLSLAYDAIKEGGIMPTALIAADETAVKAFFDRRIGFTEIADVVRTTLDNIVNREILFEADVFTAAEEAYKMAEIIVSQK